MRKIRNYCLAVAALACLASLARATPSVIVGNSTSTSTTGTFVVRITDNDRNQLIGGYNLTLSITPQSGATGTLTFAASPATAAPSPLFTSNSSPPGGNVDGTGRAILSDFDSTLNGKLVAVAGNGLVTVTYNVAANSSGKFDVVVFHSAGDALDSAVFDPDFATISDASFTNGVISVLNLRRFRWDFWPECPSSNADVPNACDTSQKSEAACIVAYLIKSFTVRLRQRHEATR